jgi:hypothetical protein
MANESEICRVHGSVLTFLSLKKGISFVNASRDQDVRAEAQENDEGKKTSEPIEGT